MKYLKSSVDHQLSWCQFLFFRPKLLYPPEQALYVVIFQPSSYPQHGLEGITFFLIAERLHKEVLSCSINFKYIICCINLFLSWQPSDKLISVFVISIMSVNVVIYSFWVTLRVIVKLQINILLIDMLISWNKDEFTATISLTCAASSIPIISILNSLFDSIHRPVFISSSLSGLFWSEFDKNTPRHAQGVDDNTVIKVYCNSRRPYIIGHTVELLRPHCHGLDGPGLAIK